MSRFFFSGPIFLLLSGLQALFLRGSTAQGRIARKKTLLVGIPELCDLVRRKNFRPGWRAPVERSRILRKLNASIYLGQLSLSFFSGSRAIPRCCSKQHTYPVPKSSHLHAASRCRTATSPSTTLCRYSSGLCLDPTALKSVLAVALLPPPGFNLLRQFPRSIQTVQKRPIGRQLPYRLTTRSCLLSRATTAIIVGRRPVQYNHPEHTLDQQVFWALLQICQFEISLLALSLAPFLFAALG